jgi:hypothetical protein
MQSVNACATVRNMTMKPWNSLIFTLGDHCPSASFS